MEWVRYTPRTRRRLSFLRLRPWIRLDNTSVLDSPDSLMEYRAAGFHTRVRNEEIWVRWSAFANIYSGMPLECPLHAKTHKFYLNPFTTLTIIFFQRTIIAIDFLYWIK